MASKLNQSTVTEILLLGFQDLGTYRMTIFFALLSIYLVSMAGNVLIIVLIANIRQLLHCPMYFFLCHISITDIILTTTVCSTLLSTILRNSVFIHFPGCVLQFFVFSSSTFIECFFLTVMSYDRYLAICKPLHYAAIMNFPYCIKLSLFSWIFSLTITFIIPVMITRLHFCGPYTINHFFCDLNPLIHLSCSDTTLLQITLFAIGIPVTGFESLFITSTYVCIFLTILRIKSSTGRQKAFSTCSSHLTIVCTYFGTLIAVYLTPSDGRLINLNKSLSLLYTVITPLFNPVIYSLKNQEIQMALKRYFHRYFRINTNAFVQCQ